jgi:hypothetical protein
MTHTKHWSIRYKTILVHPYSFRALQWYQECDGGPWFGRSQIGKQRNCKICRPTLEEAMFLHIFHDPTQHCSILPILQFTHCALLFFYEDGMSKNFIILCSMDNASISLHCQDWKLISTWRNKYVGVGWLLEVCYYVKCIQIC